MTSSCVKLVTLVKSGKGLVPTIVVGKSRVLMREWFAIRTLTVHLISNRSLPSANVGGTASEPADCFNRTNSIRSLSPV